MDIFDHNQFFNTAGFYNNKCIQIDITTDINNAIIIIIEVRNKDDVVYKPNTLTGEGEVGEPKLINTYNLTDYDEIVNLFQTHFNVTI